MLKLISKRKCFSKFQTSLELDVSILNQISIHFTTTSTMVTLQIPRKSAIIYASIILNVYFLHGIPPQVLVNICIALCTIKDFETFYVTPAFSDNDIHNTCWLKRVFSGKNYSPGVISGFVTDNCRGK